MAFAKEQRRKKSFLMDHHQLSATTIIHNTLSGLLRNYVCFKGRLSPLPDRHIDICRIPHSRESPLRTPLLRFRDPDLNPVKDLKQD